MATAHIGEGMIERGTAYTLDEFSRRTGLRRTALRMARHAGLAVRRAHGRVYVLGSDWLDYLAGLAADQGDDSTAGE